MNKFYAVRKGRKTGIFYDWDDCKSQVSGVSKAEYKSFKTLEEAEQYLLEDTITGQDDNCIAAYVDGSYNKYTKEFSFGVVLFDNQQELHFYKKFDDIELSKMHNVAGEIKGAEAAMKYAVEHGFSKIIIYHDYEGISKWCTGEWKTNKDGTKAYKAFYDSLKSKLKVEFIKVKSHSNNKYNDLADKLAKQAIFN